MRQIEKKNSTNIEKIEITINYITDFYFDDLQRPV